MKLKDFYRCFSSDTTAATANQDLTGWASPIRGTGRCWYRLSHGGENYSLLFSNAVDGTYRDDGSCCANDAGSTWSMQVRVGLCRKVGDTPEQFFPLTFDGEFRKTVSLPDPFCSDPVLLDAKAGDFLCYEISFTGACYPYHPEAVLTVTLDTGSGACPDKRVPLPLMIGSDRPVAKRIAFIGDSITQGVRTACDSYTHWPAKIAEGLPDAYSVWDLGIGCGRASDAASDGGWLARAKTCDIVHVCFGVNDLLHGNSTPEKLEGDLDRLCVLLKDAGCKVILLTVPPFDMTGTLREYWYTVNRWIRETWQDRADGFFDFAAVLGRPAPEEHMARYGGHPNAEGCRITAETYLAGNILSHI